MFNEGIFVVNADGIVIADTPREVADTHRIGLNLSSFEHIQMALKQGKSSVSAPFLTQIGNAPFLV